MPVLDDVLLEAGETVVVQLTGITSGDPQVAIDAANEALLARVNADGRFFLSHAKLDGRFALRVVVGNPRARDDDVKACWDVLREAAAAVEA